MLQKKGKGYEAISTTESQIASGPFAIRHSHTRAHTHTHARTRAHTPPSAMHPEAGLIATCISRQDGCVQKRVKMGQVQERKKEKATKKTKK